jgi:CRP-like cAMP-binding protein
MIQAGVEALRGISLVEGLHPHHIDKLVALASEVNFEADQIVFREGEARNKLYIVLSGKVALEIKAPSRVFRVDTLQEADEFGWSSMLPQGRRHFQARTLQPVRALAFDGDRLQEACREDPVLGFALLSRPLRVVSERLETTRLRLLDIYAPDRAS